MAIPVLFIATGAGSAVAGVAKAAKAVKDNSHAKKINEKAEERIRQAADKLDRPRQQCGEALENLGKEKAFVLNTSIQDFLRSFEKLKNVEFSDSLGLDELNSLHIDQNAFDGLKEMEGFASSLMSGTVAGTAGGAFVAFGAYNAAMTFATASTGTAISSLSGIAASNATLAFFGGGSLAAGGWGMAGGTMVLGGLVAGPAMLVMGLIIGAKASKNLDNAYVNEQNAKVICEQLAAAIEQCNAIRRRTYMFYSLLARLDTYFLPLIDYLRGVIEDEGTDYAAFSPEGKKIVAATTSVAAAIKAVLDTPILTEEGNLTKESEQIIDDILSVAEAVKEELNTDTVIGKEGSTDDVND